MSRHAWDKLAAHHYRCRRCGMVRIHAQGPDGKWITTFHRAGETSRGATPPCCGTLPPARTGGQWNAYVEAGATLAERRQRLCEVPDELREAVRAHVAGVFQLRQQSRERRRIVRSEDLQA